MLTYRILGMIVESDYDIGIAPCEGANPDIRILKEPISLPEMTPSQSGMFFHRSPDTIYLHWDAIGTFRINKGCCISALPTLEADEKVFIRTLTGTVMAIALYQRQRFILHASAVEAAGGAVLFAGDSKFGKSTIASNLHACGHHLIADDIAAIQVGDKEHLVYPGNQEFKLWPDSVRILGDHEDNYRRFFSSQEKRLKPVTERLISDPTPLKRVYMLEFGEEEAIELIHPAQAAIELVRNTYGITLLHSIRTTDYFHQVARLANTVPVYRLRRRKSLEYFDCFLSMVRKDLGDHQ